MKKLLFTFALLLGSLSFIYGNTPDKVFEMFKSEANAQLVNIADSMLSAIKAQVGEDADKLKGIESMTVLELSQCDQAVKDKFEEEVGKMQPDGYEILVQVNEDGVTAKVMGKVDGAIVRDMIVIVTGENTVLVTMKGFINMSDVSSMINFSS